MYISVEKTKYITINEDPIRRKSVIEHNIGLISQFEHLKIELSSSHDSPEDFRGLMNKLAVVAGTLNEMVWTNKYMKMDSIIVIYKTYVRLIMTHGIEAHEDTNKIKIMLRLADINLLRTLMEKRRRDRVRYTEIREQYGLHDVIR